MGNKGSVFKCLCAVREFFILLRRIFFEPHASFWWLEMFESVWARVNHILNDYYYFFYRHLKLQENYFSTTTLIFYSTCMEFKVLKILLLDSSSYTALKCNKGLDGKWKEYSQSFYCVVAILMDRGPHRLTRYLDILKINLIFHCSQRFEKSNLSDKYLNQNINKKKKWWSIWVFLSFWFTLPICDWKGRNV